MKQSRNSFQLWLVDWLDHDEVDPKVVCVSGNGKEITFGDVIVKIMNAKPSEKFEIKEQLIAFRKKGGNSAQLLEVYAKAITVNPHGA